MSSQKRPKLTREWWVFLIVSGFLTLLTIVNGVLVLTDTADWPSLVLIPLIAAHLVWGHRFFRRQRL